MRARAPRPGPARRLDRVVGVAVGVERAFECQRAVRTREQAGVGRAQVGAVGEPEERQPAVADRAPQPVEVARDIRRSPRRAARSVAARAALDVAPVGRDQLRTIELQRRRERLSERARGLLVDRAVDGRPRLPDPARIEADDVEAAVECRRTASLPLALRVLTSGLPGPPKLTNSEPMRRSRSRAGRRATASRNVDPCRHARSGMRGTAAEAHSKPSAARLPVQGQRRGCEQGLSLRQAVADLGGRLERGLQRRPAVVGVCAAGDRRRRASSCRL